MLPFFFLSTGLLSGKESLSPYYQVFFTDIAKYDTWLSTDRQNRFKDIFISLYNLPSKGKRVFAQEIELKVLKSYSKDEQYGYLYVEVGSQTEVQMVVYGIKKGAVTINGSKKGEIKIENETGYALLKGVFEKGIYFVSIKIEKEMEGLPVKMLSNKKLKMSKEKGFTKDASSRFTVANVNGSKQSKGFGQLYKFFCFPHIGTDDDAKKLYFSILDREDSSRMKSEKLLYFLYSLAGRVSGETEEKLKKTGFSVNQIAWWKKNFFEREVCFDGNEQ